MISGDTTTALGQAIRERVGEDRYVLWFEGKTRLSLQDNTLHIGVPNHFYQEWLDKTFGAELKDVACQELGTEARVRVAVDPELFRAARQREGSGGLQPPSDGGSRPPLRVQAPNDVVATEPVRAKEAVRPSAKQRRFRNLDDFVIGACNRVAHSAAQSLVEEPEQMPCPLLIHGPVGVGKTHLLEGIYGGLRRSRPDWQVLFLSAEEFTNRFVHAIHTNKLSGFRKQFRECNALLVDDLHFLAKKPATQEEFLHTFDVLQTQDCPVAVTCDCHPRLTEQFLPELADRLAGGAVWGLTPPERGTRLDLLRHKTLAPERAPMPADVLEFLADQLRGNVRELEGALYSVWHFARVQGRPVNLELAREALGDVLRHSVRLVQLADVEEAVCSTLRLEPKLLQSKKRGWMVSHPRMLAVYLARKHTTATYTEIGQHFGGRNHSTAVAGEKKVRDWLKNKTSLNFGQRSLTAPEVLERIERELLK